MKLHILSDLHTGFCRYGPAPVCADALVLAGDIGDDGNLGVLEVTERYRQAGLAVLYVPGNHEFYGRRIAPETLRLWRACRQAGIELLVNRSVTVGSVRFVGATLWTDFLLYGAAHQDQAFRLARLGVADFTWIFERPNEGLLPQTTARWHEKSLGFIGRTLAQPFTGKSVVISHHGCHPRSIHARFAGNAINPAFVSDLESFLVTHRPDLWVHGHVHNSFDYVVDRTRVVANPRGYAKRYSDASGRWFERRENPDFNEQLVVSL